MAAALTSVLSLPSFLRKLRGQVVEKLQISSENGFDLIFDALPFGRLWYGEPNAIGYAKFYSRSHDAVIHVYDESGNVKETHEHAGDFKEW